MQRCLSEHIVTSWFVWLQLKRLATFSDDANPAVTRILFTDADMNARRCAAPVIAFQNGRAFASLFEPVHARRWLS